MIKWTTFFSGMAIATLLLTGCGTASNDEATDTPSTNESQKTSTQTEETSTTDSQTSASQTEDTNATDNQTSASQTEDTNATDNQTSTSQTEDTNVTDSPQTKDTDAAEDQTSTSQTEDTNASEVVSQEQASETTNEKTLQYLLNNESKEDTAFLKKSDNQPFSLYVLPNFELSAEEPGKDVVLLSENDKIYMRIELLSDDVDWAKAEEDAKAFLNAISDSITEPELNINNGLSYEVTSGNDVVTAVLLKDEKAPVRLTMFTTKDADYRHAFLEMAKTIQKQ
jgi:hypothetical protein